MGSTGPALGSAFGREGAQIHPVGTQLTTALRTAGLELGIINVFISQGFNNKTKKLEHWLSTRRTL